METTSRDAPSQQTLSSRGIFGTTIPSALAFLIAILLFLLPFAELTCNGKPLAHNTGLGIAIGSDWKEDVTKDIFGDSLEYKTTQRRDYDRNQNPNLFAIIALVAGVIGCLFALLKFTEAPRVNFFAGLLGAAALIAMLIDLRYKARSDTSLKSSDPQVHLAVNVTVDGTIWFYLAAILFIIAAILSLGRGKVKSGS